MNGVLYFVQPMVAGGEYVTAWADEQKAGKLYRYATTVFDTTKGASLKQMAIDKVTSARNEGFTALQASHRAWWKNFWEKQHLLSLPETEWESFY